MFDRERRPVLFFDFDHTITLDDVLDKVIERFSVTTAWRDWEVAWQQGRMTTLECLQRQIGDLRVSSAELLRFVAEMPIEPEYAELVAWAARNAIDVRIVSDNFSSVIHAILQRNGLPPVPVFANELSFRGERPEAHFPFRDPTCARCAHCKAQHIRAVTDRARIFIGDGLSDICPASEADVVFAKDVLAAEMTRQGLPFRPFRSLAEISRFMQDRYSNTPLR